MLSVVETEAHWKEQRADDVLVLDPWSQTRSSAEARRGPWPDHAVLRRPLNVLIAFLALLLVLPLMVVIAIAIKVCSPGPVFFKQVRVGVDRRSPFQESQNGRRKIDYGGRLFTLYKFRTMDHQTGPAAEVWAQKDDPRVFPLGRVLRQLRLDELPQLINVLKGDMNNKTGW